MNWRATLSWEDAKKKALILNKIRLFFSELDVIEVETPVLGRSTVTDIHLEAFQTKFDFFSDSDLNNSDTLYLQTSPEYCMKRLLASGYQSIYQISKAFRHECKGSHHNPEFTMLEWYRLGFEQEDLMNEVASLLKEILFCNDPIKVTYQNIFIDKVGLDPLNTTCTELKQLIYDEGKMSEWLFNEESCDVLLQFIMSELIEPLIGHNEPIFIYNFPISQASLARKNKVDERVAERFECYFKGLELVNGFTELTDPVEQLNRFNKDNIYRDQQEMQKKTIDRNFIEALRSGLPNCSGVALGVDRLLMLALNKTSIDEVITFSIDRA
ncbi:elongation factor P--(R)-beta-lysine ligase [Colwellia sp. UCD-KL20]|uniref:elongation factor P--(R)-beta-lysine ligase n=1 Tax=Colwellia sp. UCD-KL20 TaxID=1917165 RepID=UPI00097081E0|nr:elongation factor P--(R)-beta-lysine ligase [Colwellia sp. UCD-KL20]